MSSKKERTLVLIKHDGIQRSLVGEIIKRLERTGLKIKDPKVMLKLILLKMKHSKTSKIVFEDQSK